MSSGRIGWTGRLRLGASAPLLAAALLLAAVLLVACSADPVLPRAIGPLSEQQDPPAVPDPRAASVDADCRWWAAVSVDDPAGLVLLDDGSVPTIRSSVALPAPAWTLAAVPDGRHLLAGAMRDGQGAVLVIDAEAAQVVGDVEVTGLPLGLAVSQDRGTLVVSSQSVTVDDAGTVEVSGLLSVVDTATWELVGQVTVGGQPEQIVVGPDGSWAAVASFLDDEIVLVDTVGLSVVDRVAVSVIGPSELVPAGSDGLLLVSGPASAAVSLVDLDGRRETDQLDLGPELTALAAVDDEVVVAVAGERRLAFLAAGNVELVDELGLDAAASRLAATGDGRVLALDRTGRLHTVEVATREVVSVLPLAELLDGAAGPSDTVACR